MSLKREWDLKWTWKTQNELRFIKKSCCFWHCVLFNKFIYFNKRVKLGLNKTTKCLKSMKRVCVTLSVGSVCFINLTSKSKLRNANSEFSYSLAAISSIFKIGRALISAGDGVQTFAGSLNFFPSREGVLSTRRVERSILSKKLWKFLHETLLRSAIYD